MTAIPAKTDFVGSSVTEGEFKTALQTLHDYLTGMLGTAGTQAAAQTALGALLGSGVLAKTSAYTVVAADRGKIVSCTNTFTLSLTASSTLGAGFSIAVANVGSGTITIDPASTETINGASTYTLPATSTVLIVCTGSGWLIIGAPPVATGTANSSTFLRGDKTWQAINTAPTTDQVLTATAGLTAGGVGTYVFGFAPSITLGGTTAGSNIKISGVGSNTIYTSGLLSGTWRCLGRSSYTVDGYGYITNIFNFVRQNFITGVHTYAA